MYFTVFLNKVEDDDDDDDDDDDRLDYDINHKNMGSSGRFGLSWTTWTMQTI